MYMKIKIVAILSAVITASMVFTSCGLFVRAGTDLMAGVEAAEWPEDPEAVSPDFVKAMNDFSWSLADTLDKKSGNMMISPASVFLALAMTLNGADGQTREDMLAALSAAGLTLEDVNKAARDWMIRLNKTDGVNKLSIVNSIWYREGFSADPAFLQRNADFYTAAARSLDFTDSSSVDAINGWVDKATNGTIKDILFLINAIYFKAQWKDKFAYEDTSDGTFESPDGSVNVKYMKRIGSMDYLKMDGAQGVLLPYSDGRFAMVALLPDEGKTPREIISLLDASAIEEMLGGRQAKEVNLSLPKFTAEFKAELQDTLTALGMGIAFDSGLADFSLMQTGREKNLYIGAVTHKTFIRVDELGTEAAAVTKVEMKFTGMPSYDVELHFTRPFLYSIIDLDTNLPLFIGVTEKP
jgi:serpin B